MPRIRIRLFLLVLASTLAAPLSAVTQSEDTTQVDAIRCWRWVDRNAVFVGERIQMTVTCSVVETDTARTLPDQTTLEPETIDVAPFEILGGDHADDIRSGSFRFFQYHYTLRFISETDFGNDIELPALGFTYRIERRVDDDPPLVGRELTYLLPAEPIRVLSLVPDVIDDIRELPSPTFDQIQTRMFRATLFTLLALLVGIVAFGAIAVGAARIVRERNGGAAQVEKRFSLLLIAHRALGELIHVRQVTAEHGWSAESAGRALATLRVAGSVAMFGTVIQTTVDANVPAREGQLRLRYGFLRHQTAVISSGLTSATLTQQFEQARTRRDRAADIELVDDLGRSISVFTTARYARDGVMAAEELTRALDIGITRLKTLRWQSAAPVRYTRQLFGVVSDWWTQAWTR
jgi:hypothetical protein